MMADIETRNNLDAESGIAGGARVGARGPADWLASSKRVYQTSRDWMDNNVRNQWEVNIRHFQSRHRSGSKYYSNDYKTRSKLFRPKTRASTRKAEAAAAAAFFSTVDIATITPNDDDDPKQLASAQLMQELLKYRLGGGKGVQWFLTVMGAFQTSHVMSICASRQYWEYAERKTKQLEPMMDPATGQPAVDADGMPMFQRKVEIVKDGPRVVLVPPENVLFDPGADWLDVVKSSPYLGVLIPMYVIDVKDRMAEIDPKTGQPKWKQLDDATITTAREEMRDRTRMVRENNRTDTKDQPTGISDYDIVWVREWFMRRSGQDYQFYTLGGVAMLTDPVPIEDVYPTGERPIVIGYGAFEAFRTYPESKVGMMQDLQVEANDVSNQRLDNVKLHMNGRNFVKRGANVDLKQLLRNSPGASVMMNNPKEDVVVIRPSDVTASSYQEQDRINVDFDEIAGTFSNSSVQSNRQLNETVGGMNLLSGNANALGEYDMRVFTETWVEPVLRQVIKLEQYFESDPVILALAGKKAQLIQKYGVDTITDELIQNDLTLTVNVGIGATDPMQKLNKFGMAMKMVVELFTSPAAAHLNIEEVIAEIFGHAGYKDGDRFFKFEQDPQVEMLQKTIEQLKQALEGKQMEVEGRIHVAEIGAKSRTDVAQIGAQVAKAQTMTQAHIEEMKNATGAHVSKAQTVTSAHLDELKAKTPIEVALINARLALLLAGVKAIADQNATAADQQHQAGMAQADRTHQSGMADATRAHQTDQADAQRDFEALLDSTSREVAA